MLVHAGTGGVGLAAIHLGKAGGSTVLATAGNSSKRAHMRNLGVSTAISSRDTSFSDVIAVSSGAPALQSTTHHQISFFTGTVVVLGSYFHPLLVFESFLKP